MSQNVTISNQTLIVAASSISDLITQQAGYIILGLIGLSLSGLIGFSLLLKGVELRQGQRHVLLTTMEISNFALNLTFFLAGCFRVKYILTGEYKLTTSPWECMLRFYSPMFAFTLQFVPLTLFANACERFVAVYCRLIYYHKVKTRHQVYASVFMVAYCAMATVAGYVCAYYMDPLKPLAYNCITINALGPSYTSFLYSTMFFYTLISALASLAVALALARKKKVGDTNNGIPSSYVNRQKSLTHALVLAILFVFLLMCFPITALFVTAGLRIVDQPWLELIVPYSGFIMMAHSIISDITLCAMNRQVRNSIKSLFGRVSSKVGVTTQSMVPMDPNVRFADGKSHGHSKMTSHM